ncbi:MAG: hypothetical protein ABIQ95_09715, partial [Bdellovibrionia bacterium]
MKKSSRYLLDYLESGKSKLHPYYSKFKNGRPYLEGAMMTDQPIFHDWLFKVPLAGTSRYSRIPDLLRVPMSFIMREAIQRLQLRELHIPKKCLIQLFDRSLIDSWYSAEKNNGFLVLTEKEDLFSLAETIAAIHEWSETKQRDI